MEMPDGTQSITAGERNSSSKVGAISADCVTNY